MRVEFKFASVGSHLGRRCPRGKPGYLAPPPRPDVVSLSALLECVSERPVRLLANSFAVAQFGSLGVRAK